MPAIKPLNRSILAASRGTGLPEKVLQFGSGVLLRALPDLLIDQANRQGIFQGKVVIVKSTGQGDGEAFSRQNNLYTVCIRGIENGRIISENQLCTAVSRLLSASKQWHEVLEVAKSDELQIVISNTTEVGIQRVEEDIFQRPPGSFPGKLLAVLFERYRHFKGAPGKGLVIIPTELLPDNGGLLKSILLDLAVFNRLEPGFSAWLRSACTFCSSLVDRIVPGKPAPAEMENYSLQLGYHDDLLTIAEPYALWAIEGDEQVAQVLSFHLSNPASVVITPDITRYRERKLRLLNGTHTLGCGLAIQAGFKTVAAAMENHDMAAYLERLMREELAPAIPYPLPEGDADEFGRQVLDRFRNPFVAHLWQNITVQYSAKMRMRNIPLLHEYCRKSGGAPTLFSLGFAAYLCFFRQPNTAIRDDQAGYLSALWENLEAETLVDRVLANRQLWGLDLREFPGFAELTLFFVREILEKGARKTLQEALVRR